MHQIGDERTKSVRLASGAAVLAVCLVVTQIPIAFAATTVENVEGEAYGAYASIDLGLVSGTLGPVPSVALTPDEAVVSKTAATVDLNVGLTVIVDVDALEVSSAASGVGGGDGSVQSVAVVTGTDILGGIIHADEVTASCSADSSGAVAGLTLEGASVAGVGALPVSPAPNTGISIPGVGSMTLNQQTTDSDGTLTVTGLSLSLLPVLGTGTVNIARAVCGVETSATTTATTVAQSPPTTEGPSQTEPGPTTTTTPGGPTTTTSPGPTTSTTSEASTTTSSPDDSTTTTAVSPAKVSASALDGSGSGGDVAEDNEPAGAGLDGGGASLVVPEHDISVAGLMIQGSGGPPAPGQTDASADIISDSNQSSRPWPTPVDFAIIGILAGAAAMLAYWKLPDFRRLIREGWSANR
jgi:hypothetical protein